MKRHFFPAGTPTAKGWSLIYKINSDQDVTRRLVLDSDDTTLILAAVIAAFAAVVSFAVFGV